MLPWTQAGHLPSDERSGLSLLLRLVGSTHHGLHALVVDGLRGRGKRETESHHHGLPGTAVLTHLDARIAA